MKFCPQCGTTFEPDARFCLECGFDRSTVEATIPENTAVPGVINSETWPASEVEASHTVTEVKPHCPQCGSALDIHDRFCQECGFDTANTDLSPDVTPAPEQPPASEVTALKPEPAEAFSSHVDPVTETVLPPPGTQFCPQCGSGITPGERFCQECGFDTANTDLSPNVTPVPEQTPAPEVAAITPEPAEAIITHADPVAETVLPSPSKQFCPQCGSGITPDERFCQECGFDTMVATVKSETSPESVKIPPLAVPPPTPQPENVPPTPEPAPVTRMAGTRAGNYGEAAPQPKKKKTFIWVALIVVLLGALGAAGWFVYNNYVAAPDEKLTDTGITAGVPESAGIQPGVTDEAATAQPETTVPEQQSKANTKTISRMDQELARQKAKETNQPSQPAVVDESPVITPHITANEIVVKVLLEVGKKEDPKNKNPRNPSKLTIQKRSMIVKITTDHYNDGMGTPGGGTITIKDRNDNIIGSFKALGRTGKNGTPSAKWVATPNIMLEKGTYFISDSEPSTWSKTFIGSNGFIVVEGYEVE